MKMENSPLSFLKELLSITYNIMNLRFMIDIRRSLRYTLIIS